MDIEVLKRNITLTQLDIGELYSDEHKVYNLLIDYLGDGLESREIAIVNGESLIGYFNINNPGKILFTYDITFKILRISYLPICDILERECGFGRLETKNLIKWWLKKNYNLDISHTFVVITPGFT